MSLRRQNNLSTLHYYDDVITDALICTQHFNVLAGCGGPLNKSGLI